MVSFEKEILYLNKQEKDTVKKKKSTGANIHKIHSTELVSRLYEECLQLSNKTDNPVKKGRKVWTDILPKKID